MGLPDVPSRLAYLECLVIATGLVDLDGVSSSLLVLVILVSFICFKASGWCAITSGKSSTSNCSPYSAQFVKKLSVNRLSKDKVLKKWLP